MRNHLIKTKAGEEADHQNKESLITIPAHRGDRIVVVMLEEAEEAEAIMMM